LFRQEDRMELFLSIHLKFNLAVQNGSLKFTFILSGQSNMEWPMSAIFDAEAEIAATAAYPNIRLFRIGYAVANFPLLEIATGKLKCFKVNLVYFLS
jgi:hypothetical protein